MWSALNSVYVGRLKGFKQDSLGHKDLWETVGTLWRQLSAPAWSQNEVSIRSKQKD